MSVVGFADGSPAAFDTHAVYAGGDRQAVSPDLYTGLEVESVPAAHEVAAAEAAVAEAAANGDESRRRGICPGNGQPRDRRGLAHRARSNCATN